MDGMLRYGIDLIKIKDQNFWHIRKGGSLPGMIGSTLCGDVGRVIDTGYIKYAFINEEGMCADCRETMKMSIKLVKNKIGKEEVEND